MNIYLAEITHYDAATGDVAILRLSSGPGFATRPTDDPADTFYDPLLKIPHNYECHIFRDGITGGAAEGGFGTMQIINAMGQFDALMAKSFDGWPVRILRGDADQPYATFTPVLTGVMCQPEFRWSYLNVKIRDYAELFARPVSQTTYLGNNVGGQGTEGTADDLLGKTKPVTLGRCWYVPAAYVSTAWSIFQVHNGPTHAIDAVFLMGISQPQDMSYGGTIESGACAYLSATSFTVAGNKTAVYTAGLRLLVTQSDSNQVNPSVASSTYSASTGLTTVTLAALPLGSPMPKCALTSAAISKVAYGGGDCASVSALQAATPLSGMYVTCLAKGMFLLVGYGGSTVLAHVRGDAEGGVYAGTIADIVARLAAKYVRRPRKNYLPWSESFTSGGWVNAGFTPSTPSGVIPPVSGMQLTHLAGAAGSSLAVTLPLGTGMYCLSWAILGTGSVQIMLCDPAGETNNCLADFDLSAGQVSDIQTNGNAVGPQYMAAEFITDAGVIQEPSGFVRIWLAGQPNTTFTSLKAKLIANDAAGFVLGGAQVEAYSSPAIYTGPTTGTAVGADEVGSYYALGYDPAQGPELDAASFDALKAAVPYEVGYHVPYGDTSTCADVANALLQSAGCWSGFDGFGRMSVGRFAKATNDTTPVATWTATQVLKGTLDHPPAFTTKDGTPPYRVNMSCVRNWSPQQKSDVATSLWTSDPMRVAWMGNEWRIVRAEDIGILNAHPLACELDYTSYIANLADAVTEAKRLLALYSGPLDRFTFTVKLADATGVSTGSSVRLENIPRLSLFSGKTLTVVGMSQSRDQGKLNLEVMG